jgi:hypothetical protein
MIPDFCLAEQHKELLKNVPIVHIYPKTKEQEVAYRESQHFLWRMTHFFPCVHLSEERKAEIINQSENSNNGV